MAKVIGIMGESGSGKTTAMRTLDPKITFYFDADDNGIIDEEIGQAYKRSHRDLEMIRNGIDHPVLMAKSIGAFAGYTEVIAKLRGLNVEV